MIATAIKQNDKIYDELIGEYNDELNEILKTQLTAVTNADELAEMVNRMKELKIKCKTTLVNIINKNLIPSYENFQRTKELQKTTIGLNYTKYHQNVKLAHLAPRNETLQHFKQIILVNKMQELQFDLVKNYIKVLYHLKPLLIDLSKNFILLKDKLKLQSFDFETSSTFDINPNLLLSDYLLVFKTCEIYSSLDVEVKKFFPDLNKYDVFKTIFSKKILPSVDIPDEPINIVNQSHKLLLAAIKSLFVESSKNLEQNNKVFKKTDIKYAEVLDVSLKSFPLLNENETGVKQYSKYIQSIISDASRDIITLETQSGKNSSSLFKLLKIASAIINTHIDILSNYYSDSAWLLKVMESILLELDIQCGLIIDIELDSLIRNSIGISKDILNVKVADFQKNNNLEIFVSQYFEIVGFWNMFEKFFSMKFLALTIPNENSDFYKPLCLKECLVNKKIAQILESQEFINILRENVQINMETIFGMEKVPNINRYLNSFEKIEMNHSEEDYPVSSILDDFAIIFKRYLVLFINTGNYQIFDLFLKKICLSDFINKYFIKVILNKLGELSIVTTNLCQYLDAEKLNTLQQVNSGGSSDTPEQINVAGKSLFNLQHYTATIFQQQQQQAMKLGKDLINSNKQTSGFIISNNVTDDENMRNFHLLLIYINTLSSLSPTLQQLLVDELLEPEYNSNDESANKTVIESNFIFKDNAKVLSFDIAKIVDSTKGYVDKITDNYTEKIFQIAVKHNLFEFSKKILNSEYTKFTDISQPSSTLPSLSVVGKNARGFGFSYMCNPSDLNNLTEVSEFIKKLELLVQPFENVMLSKVYYAFKLRICQFLNDDILVKKFFKIIKMNSLGVIKFEKEVNSVIKTLCFDKNKGIIDYSLRLKFEKILQIIEILNYDEVDFKVLKLNKNDDREEETIDINTENMTFKYVLNQDLKESTEWILSDDEINRIRMILV
ncbi:hypothetical protein QEN19_000586 [Hanseniaspora menglaensis]